MLPMKCDLSEARENLRKLKALGLIIGTDEAGRGALAGPVAAAAVCLTDEQEKKLLSMKLRDSKLISPNVREKIFAAMMNMSVQWRIAWGNPSVIDEKNILQASLLMMSKCVSDLAARLKAKPVCVIADGNRKIPGINLDQWTLIRADKMIPAVSAASIVAKVLRGRLMRRLAERYPGYGLEKNKGYPTRAHIAKIREIGLSEIHRQTFCKKILEI